MIVKNVKTGKYEMIQDERSYYFDIAYSKYNINISAPLKPTYLLIQEKINHVYR